MDEYELPPMKGTEHFRHRTMDEQVNEASTSIRRWWWEYLRLSKDYWYLCQTCAEGEPDTFDETLAQLFRDFGNVHKGTFEDWWRRTGSALFAERSLPPRVEQITSVESAIAGNRAGKILVEIPLQLTRETVQKQLNEILDRRSDERNALIRQLAPNSIEVAKGREITRSLNRLDTSTSRYPIEPVLTRLAVVQQAHEVYCLHRELIEKPKALARLGIGRDLTDHDNKANLFRIGKVYGLSPQNASLAGYADDVAKKTKKMRSEVRRVLDRAETLLNYVEAGHFAVINEDRLPVKPRFSSKQDAVHAKLEEQWWSLDLHSTLSESKIEKARELHYRGD